MGTSWGGMYGFLYLFEHQAKVNAFACIDGKVNIDYQIRSLIEYELNLVDELLQKENTAMLNLMNYTVEEFEQAAHKAEIVNKAFRNDSAYNNINIEQNLKQINTPVLVIQGKKDYVVGLKHGKLIYDTLTGLKKENKELHLLPDVGHSPAIEAPETLSSLVILFFRNHSPD